MNNGKKIGIITYHRAINYGAVLQAYALQETLKQFGADPYILDYRNTKLEEHHKEMKLSECKSLKQLMYYLLLGRKYNEKFRYFREFSKMYLRTTTPYYSITDLEKSEDEFDLFITGSDQVWNYKINKMDPAYFLSFTSNHHKKNTYAASFGVNSIPSDLLVQYKNLLKDYNSFLIREKQGAMILNELLDQSSDVVLDPTLLINKETWFKIADNNNINSKYILIYAFGGSTYIIDFAKKLSKKTGLKVIAISNTYRKSSGISYINSAGPEQFLGLFKNAEYIVTNSFHGTVFSINFNKQFFTELLPSSVGTNSRMEDVLELFGLTDRQLFNSNVDISSNLIDYTKVNEILEDEREKSKSLLNNIISN